MQEIWVPSLGQEDPLEKGMTTHSSILAWEIPWTEEPGGPRSMGSQRTGHDQDTNNTEATTVATIGACSLRAVHGTASFHSRHSPRGRALLESSSLHRGGNRDMKRQPPKLTQMPGDGVETQAQSSCAAPWAGPASPRAPSVHTHPSPGPPEGRWANIRARRQRPGRAVVGCLGC